jgi:hypothetical protein
MLRHFRFVHDHHRAVRRMALAADDKPADLMAGLAEHFVHAEIKGFDYDDLDDAVAWAAGPTGAPPSRRHIRTGDVRTFGNEQSMRDRTRGKTQPEAGPPALCERATGG